MGKSIEQTDAWERWNKGILIYLEKFRSSVCSASLIDEDYLICAVSIFIFCQKGTKVFIFLF